MIAWPMSQNINAHDTSFNNSASSIHRQRGLLTFHTDGQFFIRYSSMACGRVGHSHILQHMEPVDTGLHVMYTNALVHMCALNACMSVSKRFFSSFFFFYFIMCVFTKAHSFSVIGHTQPVKTIRATGLENAQTVPWEAKAIPNDTALSLLRFRS